MTERPILFSALMVRAIRDGSKTATRRIMKPQPSDTFSPEVGFYNPTLTDKRTGEAYPGPERFGAFDESEDYPCPYGVPVSRFWVNKPGDRLWVKETWHTDYPWNGTKPTDLPENVAIHYAATSENFTGRVLRPSLFMRRWMSRLTLEITDIRVERLHEITEEQAIAEGVKPTVSPDLVTLVFSGGDTLQISPKYVHGVPKPGDTWEDRLVAHVEPSQGSIISTARDNFRALWCGINGPESWEQNPWVWAVSFRKINPVSEIQ